jgi:hypothetical protein
VNGHVGDTYNGGGFFCDQEKAESIVGQNPVDGPHDRLLAGLDAMLGELAREQIDHRDTIVCAGWEDGKSFGHSVAFCVAVPSRVVPSPLETTAPSREPLLRGVDEVRAPRHPHVGAEARSRATNDVTALANVRNSVAVGHVTAI